MNLPKRLFFASLAALSLLLTLPCAGKADGFLQKGDTAHPIPFYATDPSGNPLNGLTLTEQTVKNVTTSVAGTGTFTQPDPTGAPGLYAYTPSATDVDTYGTAVFNATATAGTGYAAAVINGNAKTIVAFNPSDPSLLGLSGVATLAGQTSLTSGQASIKADTTKIGTAAASSPTAPAWYSAPPALPTDFLSVLEKASLLSASTAQQAGQPVTLPANAPATFLASDVTLAGIPEALLSRPLGHGMTVGQLLVLLQASNGPGAVTNTWNAATHTLTTAYQFPSDSAPVRSDGTVYPASQVTAPPVLSRTTTLGTLPQP